MSPRLDQQELRRRAVAGIADEVAAFGRATPDSRLICHPGLSASVSPGSPERSIFNAVSYEQPNALAERIEELTEAYADHGVRAWTVWVPDGDRESAAALERRGHSLDGAPRAMALDLADLATEPRRPEAVEQVSLESADGAALNARAYGYDDSDLTAGFGAGAGIRWFGASEAGESLGCVGAIDAGDDCCVTGVATPPEHRGRGIASWLLWRALADARERGFATASLRASRAGAPLYERLGFRDLGFVELWELRR
jgi:GNAT superfamily N-acetyltransferase